MPRMPRLLRTMASFCILLLAACSGVSIPPPFTPAPVARNPGRLPLDVPPQLQPRVEKRKGATGQTTVMGKAVLVEMRDYARPPARVLAATVAAMKSLKIPVESVDPPSGTITAGWMRRDSKHVNGYLAALMGLFGSAPEHTRYRFIVRVLTRGQGRAQLQVRTLAQKLINGHWANMRLESTITPRLFAAVEQRLGVRDQGSGIRGQGSVK